MCGQDARTTKAFPPNRRASGAIKKGMSQGTAIRDSCFLLSEPRSGGRYLAWGVSSRNTIPPIKPAAERRQIHSQRRQSQRLAEDSRMKRLLNILFWSVIAAAFIGPGTVTTAARAGSDFRFALAWALLFSVFACLVLQEASGRITVLTGKELGEAIRERFSGSGWARPVPAARGQRHHPRLRGLRGRQPARGSRRDAADRRCLAGRLTLIAGSAAALLLATGNTRWIARIAGALVAVMGVAFLVTAVRLGPDLGDLLSGPVRSADSGRWHRSGPRSGRNDGGSLQPLPRFGSGPRQRARRDAVGPGGGDYRWRGHLARRPGCGQRPRRRARVRAAGRGPRRPALGRGAGGIAGGRVSLRPGSPRRSPPRWRRHSPRDRCSAHRATHAGRRARRATGRSGSECWPPDGLRCRRCPADPGDHPRPGLQRPAAAAGRRLSLDRR